MGSTIRKTEIKQKSSLNSCIQFRLFLLPSSLNQHIYCRVAREGHQAGASHARIARAPLTLPKRRSDQLPHHSSVTLLLVASAFSEGEPGRTRNQPAPRHGCSRTRASGAKTQKHSCEPTGRFFFLLLYRVSIETSTEHLHLQHHRQGLFPRNMRSSRWRSRRDAEL